MIESIGTAVVTKIADTAISTTIEGSFTKELSHQLMQQESFKIGELSTPELKNLGDLKKGESEAASDIRNSISGSNQDISSPEVLKRNKADNIADSNNDIGTVNKINELDKEVTLANDFAGGSYKDLPSREGCEKHHMPADSISPLNRGDGPSIQMEIDDHRQTHTYGGSRESIEARQAQKQLVDDGKFQEAFDMDVADIRSKFNGKYDGAIAGAQNSLDTLKSKGLIS